MCSDGVNEMNIISNANIPFPNSLNIMWTIYYTAGNLQLYDEEADMVSGFSQNFV